MDRILWQMLLQMGLISLNAVFACAEIAVISMNDNKMNQMAEDGDVRAIRLVKLTSQPARFLATIQVAITLSGFLGSAFAAENFSDMLVDFLVKSGVTAPVATLDAISVVVITLILSYFTLVFGELVPKRLAMKKAEQLALSMSALITVISKIFAPIVWTLTASTNFVLRLCGVDPKVEDETFSEEEIRMMVDAGSEKGVIDPEEKEIINNLFEFDDLPVSKFVTHRTDVEILWLEDSNAQWDTIIHQSRYSLYPICDQTADEVVGILSAKDYFRIKDKSRENILKSAVKKAYFVPETVCADVLFKQFKTTGNRLAIVIDEYGGVTGIVTMNDILEQLVGDFELETLAENEILNINRNGENTWEIKGSALLEDVSEELGVELPIDEYETFGGLVFGHHGFVPEDGKRFELTIDNLKISVVDVSEHKLNKAIVEIIPTVQDE